MKKFIKFMMGMFLFALLLAGSSMCQSCDHRYHVPIDDEEFQDKLDQYLPQALKNVYAFDDVTDVMLYKQERSTQLFVDSIFLSMTDQEIANVVAVLKKQQDKVGVSDIVYEYRANKRIYSNLPDAPKTTSTLSEEPDPPVAETNKRDSLIQVYEPLKKP